MSSHNASQAAEDAAQACVSLPPHACTPWLPTTDPSDPSGSPKTYHATAVWGKRGMTLQELTRAFDAFNEAEERVALTFADSEDCNRKLAEPLSEVKTVFLDLDGLKPVYGSCPSFPPPPAPSRRNRISHIPQYARERNELGYVLCADSTSTPSNNNNTPPRAPDPYPHSPIDTHHRPNQDTIRPSSQQKRRRSLHTASSSGSGIGVDTSSRYDTALHLQEAAERPPSRLGFVLDGNGDEYGSEDGGGGGRGVTF